jgi:aspartyl-tRNA(Asn)/glutamyl-tRNA(Gln) amidotransferase subunit C
MELSLTTVRHIAKLAALALPEEGLPTMQAELSTIMTWVEALQSVPTEGVAPMASVSEVACTLRPDTVTDGHITADILANSTHAYDYFVVPKVLG